MSPSQRIRVPCGFAFAALCLYFARPTWIWFASGTALAAAGLLFRIWAAGHLEKWKRLAVTGPYRFTRNPLYFGSFLMGLGFTLASAQGWLVGLFVLLFLSLYLPVMRTEENELADAFGQRYLDYRSRVSLFFPLPGASLPAAGRFAWRSVLANREYNAVAGFLILAAIVAVKLVWA